jgi:hypothetical protein
MFVWFGSESVKSADTPPQALSGHLGQIDQRTGPA